MSTGVTLAQAPFDDPRADLILQSSGGKDPVQFRVSKFILSLASPIFADMFNIPSPPASSQNPRDEIQVVHLSEDSEALDLCLRHLYPMRPPKVAELPQMRKLAEFAHKYQVDALEYHVTQYLTDALDLDPVGIYAIAVTYEYKSVGIKAARLSLKLPFSRLQSSLVQHTPAMLYGELLMYHAACGEAASAVTSQRSWFSSLAKDFVFVKGPIEDHGGCSSCFTPDFIRVPLDKPDRPLAGPLWVRSGKEKYREGPRCLWNYLHRSTIVLAHHPNADAVTTEEFVLRECDCTKCTSTTSRQMLQFSKAFGREISKAIALVPLPQALGPLQ